jgi:hypothetical protein
MDVDEELQRRSQKVWTVKKKITNYINKNKIIIFFPIFFKKIIKVFLINRKEKQKIS